MEDRRPITVQWVTCLAILLLVPASQVAFGATVEHTATLGAFAGEVKVLKGGTTPIAPSLRMVLRSKDIVYTGKDSSAIIVFPDGSAIQLEPKTRFAIQLLEYSQGGQRRRSFSLHYGAVIARVSRFFGAGSKASISTPTAVAAARGTGFHLSYDVLTQTTVLSVTDGTVEFSCGGITTLCHEGETIVARGTHRGNSEETPDNLQSQYLDIIGSLAAFETQPPSVLENVFPSQNLPAPIEPIVPQPPTTNDSVPPGVVLLPDTNMPPTEPPTPPPFTPSVPESHSRVQGTNWAIPGLLGAGILAAAMLGGGGSRGGTTPPVPEAGSLLVLSIGISGFVGMITRARRRTVNIER